MDAIKHTPGLGWALVHPTLCSREYMPVEIIRRGKRFTHTRTREGHERRETTRGLWDGFPTEDAAYAELQKLRDSTASTRAAIAKAEDRS